MNPARILVVEDNPTARKLFRITLQMEGYEVIEAGDGQTALAWVEREPPALVLQDLLLPDMGGLELLKRMRALPNGRDLPIVALSGFRSIIEEAKLMPLGFDATLVKPVERSSLLAAVRALLPKEERRVDTIGQGRVVLLVDDDAVQLKLVRLRLLDAGFEVISAPTGLLALSIAVDRHPALILTDVLMPDLDGFELCAAVRSEPKLSGVPVVLMSAHFVDERDRELGRNVGAFALAIRTPHLTEVLDAVHRALDTPPDSPASAFPRSEHKARLAHRLKQLASLNATLLQRCAQQAAQLSIVGGVADALSRSEDIDAVLQDVLAACLDAGGISKGALFREDAQGVMVSDQSVGFLAVQHEVLADVLRDSGTVAFLSAGKPLALSALLGPEKHDVFVSRAGLTAAVIVPIMVDGYCRAALILGCGEGELEAEDLLAFGRAIGAYVGQALALSSAFGRLSATAEADRILFSSLDSDTILRSLGALVIARMADVCEIDIVENDQSLRRAVSAHADPAKLEILREMVRRYPPRLDATSPRQKVLASKESYLCSDKTDATRQAIARDGEHLRMLCEIGLRSHMIVPILLKGRIVALLSIGTSRPGRRHGKMDLALAEELAGRAAVALENAALYRQAQEASRAKDEFLATVSHELRTPLNAMLGWARMLRGGTLPVHKRDHALAAIERNAVAQTALIADILDVSSIVSGKLRLKAREVGVAAVVEAALDSVRLALEAKSIQYEAEVDPDITLVCDGDRLRQVIWNLLSNSIKFTPKGGTIALVLAAHPTYLELSVRDSGQGIPRDFLPRVFERFQQADGSITRAHGGLGLGLAICRHIVELHGGTIEAESDGEGKGSLFRVKLPRASIPAERASSERLSPPPPGESSSRPTLDGIRCLVVDDDPEAQALMLVLLEGSGAIVSVAGSVDEAMSRLGESPHDVLISDLGMPHADGMTLIRAVRRLPAERTRTLPAIAVSGYARAQDKSAALLAGFQMHFAKPFEPSELLAAVATLAHPAST